MTIITLPETNHILPVSFDLQYLDTYGMSRGGVGQVVGLGPALWAASYQMTPLTASQRGQFTGFVDRLDNGRSSFYAFDKRRCRPLAYASGFPVGFSGVCQIASVDAASPRLVSLENLPADFQFSAGDYIAFDYDSGVRRALHRVQADVSADGNGDVQLTVNPPVRSGWAVGADVQLEKPACLMSMVPNSFQPGQYTAQRSDWASSFNAVQRIEY